MANRYWVGGTANWDGTAGTKWATTDGGAGGAAEPTVSDDVFFTALSGNVVVTVGTGTRSCRSLNCTGFTGTMTFAASLNIGDGAGGALTFSNTMTVTFTGAFSLSFVSSSTNGGAGWPITMNGRTWTTGGLNFSNAAGKWTLQDAISMTGTLTLTSGTLDTNGKSVDCSIFSISGSLTRALTLGTSTINTQSSSTAWNASSAANLTLSALSSTINVVNGTFGGGGLAYGTVNITGISGSPSLIGANTFINLTIGSGVSKTGTLLVLANQTVSGMLTITSNSVVNRMFVRSDVSGTPRTITAAAVALTDVDFMDIAAAGASTPWTAATNLGDCLGNSGITFPAGTVQTHTAGGTTNWSTLARWTSRVPLPQDDVIIDDNTTGTLTMDMPRLGKNINLTGFAGTLSTNLGVQIFGSWTNTAGLIRTGAGGVSYCGRGTHTISTAGVASPQQFIQFAPGGSYTLLGDFTTTSTSAFQVSNGTFDANDFNVTAQLLSITGTGTRTVRMGNGIWTAMTTTTSSVWTAAVVTGLTFDAEGSTIVIATASANTRTFAGGGLTYNSIIYTVADSPGILSFTGNNTFKTFNVASGRSLTLTAGTTNTITNLFNVNGQNYGYLYLPGVTGNAPSTPSSVALDIAGDIELMFDGSVDNVSLLPNLISRDTQAGSTRTLYLRIMTGNVGQLVWFDASGTVRAATGVVNLGFTNGVRFALKATLDVDNGAGGHLVSFYTASTSAGPWTLRETTTAGAFTTNIRTGQSVPLAIGVNNSSTLAAVVGMKVYRTWVKNGINGTSAFDADFTTKPFGADTFTESSPNAATVTINGALAQVGDGRVLIDSITTATHTLRVPATTSIDRVKIAHSTLTANSAYAGANSVNGGSNSTNPGWIFADSAKGNFLSVI